MFETSTEDDVLDLGQQFQTPRRARAVTQQDQSAPMAPTAIPDMGGFGMESPTPPRANQGGQVINNPSAQPTPQTTTTQAGQFDEARRLPDLTRRANEAQNPRERAVLRDQSAREIARNLTAQGHRVSWKGNQLIVDGRPYVIGDGQQPQAGPAGMPEGATPAPGGWSFDQPFAPGTEMGSTQPVGGVFTNPVTPVGGANQYGNTANLDPNYIRQSGHRRVSAAWQGGADRRRNSILGQQGPDA